MINRFFTILLLLTATNLFAQDKSNKGKEFWLGYGHNVLFTADNPPNGQTLVLYLSAEEATSVTVSVNGTGWSQTVSIPANTVDYSVIIPKTGTGDARLLTEGHSTRGIHIVSTRPIVVYAHQYGLLSSGATMLMPVETFGYTYYSLNYNQLSNYPNSFSWFYVVASENNTRLEITPSDTTQAGWIKGQTYIVNLNKGEIYNVFGKATSSLTSKDMTGSKIVSVPGADGLCHPVAVFSGSSRMITCTGDGGEFMQQQIFPASAWGTRYLTYHTVNNVSTNIAQPFLNIYRIAVTDPTTVVKRNGVPLTGLVNNFFYEYSSDGGDYIEADKPVMIAQLTPSSNQCTGTQANPFGDPEMFYLSPIEQGLKKVIFYNTRNQLITLNYVNILVPLTGIPSLLFDGAPVTTANYIVHPTKPDHAVVVMKLNGPAAQHSITCDSTFTATVYGWGTFESYGYNVGTLVNNLNALSSIRNSLSILPAVDSFACRKTPFRLYLRTAYRASNMHWKLSAVAGMSPNTDSIITDPQPLDSGLVNGRRYYTYTLQQDFQFADTGTYLVPITYSSPFIDHCSQEETVLIPIQVRMGPKADFSHSNSLCVGDSIQFTASTTTAPFSIYQYQWQFNDNTTAQGLSTTKKIGSGLTQGVRLAITATNGCVGDTIKMINLSPTPIAAFGLSNVFCARDTIQISDSSYQTQVTISSWNWNLGDGTIVNATTGTPFGHSYSAPGIYTVSLQATGVNGCKSDTVKKTVTIQPKPVASFSTAGTICLGDSLLITDASSLPGGSISSWSWNFGDGNQSTTTNSLPFYHTYGTSGSFVIRLNVTGSNGCLDDTSITATITSLPVADFSYTGKLCKDSVIVFTSNQASSPGAVFWWWFGDGQTGSGSSNTTAHQYGQGASNITVKHLVSYGAGCRTDTVQKVIPLIAEAPSAQFSMNRDTICAGSSVSFNALPDNTVSSWQWNFGNGTGNTPAQTRTFANAGIYNISLITGNGTSCFSQPFTRVLRVQTAPVVNAGPDRIMVVGDSISLAATATGSAAAIYSWSPANYVVNPASVAATVFPPTDQEFTFSAIDPITGCSDSDRVWVQVVSELHIPNAFTPNGDGKNDQWKIPGLALYPEAVVLIYNRWGQKIYETKAYHNRPWDGRLGNIIQPNDSYVYLIRLPDGRVIKGTVTIIR